MTNWDGSPSGTNSVAPRSAHEPDIRTFLEEFVPIGANHELQGQIAIMQQRLDTPDDSARTEDEFPNSERHPELDVAQPAVPRLPGFAAQLIGQRMRAMYDIIAQEPVPDDLLDLVRQLESKEQSK